jgi:hypothetical protein
VEPEADRVKEEPSLAPQVADTDSSFFRAVVEFVESKGLHHRPKGREVRIDPRVLSEDHPMLCVNNESLSSISSDSASARARILSEMRIPTTDVASDLKVCGSTGGLDAINFAATDSAGVGTLKEVPERCRARFASIAVGGIKPHRSCTQVLKKRDRKDTMYVSMSTLEGAMSCATAYAIEVTDDSFFAYRLYLVEKAPDTWIVAKKRFIDGAKS